MSQELATPTPLPSSAASKQTRIKQIRQTYLATKAFSLELQTEKIANDRVLSQLRQFVASTGPAYSGEPTPFSHLAGAKATNDALAFTANQFGLIRKSVAEVKPKYDALLATQSTEPVITTPDAERQQYIEKMATLTQFIPSQLSIHLTLVQHDIAL